MGVVESGQVVQVSAQMAYGLVNDIINVFHYEMLGGVTEDDDLVKLVLAAELDSAYSLLLADYGVDLLFDKLVFYNISADRPMGEESWPTLVNGTNSNDALPLQNATQVNFRTGVKRSQGRKYLGGFTESGSDGAGLVDPAFQGRLQAWADDLLIDPTVGSGSMQIGHIKQSTGEFIPWTTAQARPLFATQRRRKLGVGS